LPPVFLYQFMKFFTLWDKLYRSRFLYLTISVLLYLLIPPFLPDISILNALVIFLYTLVLAFCLVIISGHERPKATHLILLIILVVPFFRTGEGYYNATVFLLIAFMYGWAAFKIIIQLLKKETVDVDAILGAVGGYVLIGLSGSFVNAFISIIYPEAFNIPVIYDSVYNFVYFTFVSYTTLGYGDITPRIPQSQAISVLLALIGQIYLTILVAILIGKFLFNLGKQESDPIDK